MANIETVHTNLISVRNLELQMLWIRFNVHLVINGGLLVAFLTAAAESPLRLLGKAPHYFGLILATLWLCSELAGRANLHHYDDRVGVIENLLKKDIPGNWSAFSNTSQVLRRHSFVSLAFIAVFAFAWLYLLCSGVPVRK